VAVTVQRLPVAGTPSAPAGNDTAATVRFRPSSTVPRLAVVALRYGGGRHGDGGR